MRYFLTADVIRNSMDLVKVAFLEAANGKAKLARLPSVHIVVTDPTISFESGTPFAKAILFEETIGKPDAVCVDLARSKTAISWQYKMYSQVAQQMYPYLLVEGMTIWGGGVYLHEMAAGASGVQYQMDQWVAELTVITLRSQCVRIMRELVSAGVNFLGGKPK